MEVSGYCFEKSVKHDCVRFTFLGALLRTFLSQQSTMKITLKVTQLRTFFNTTLPFIDENIKNEIKTKNYFKNCINIKIVLKMILIKKKVMNQILYHLHYDKFVIWDFSFQMC